MDGKRQKAFLKAMEEMVEEKGINEDIIVSAISEAFKITYNKKLSDELLVVQKVSKVKKPKKQVVELKKTEDGEELKADAPAKLADALIKCDIDLEKGTILTFRQWKIVPEDLLEDDFVEISDKDPKIINSELKVGDFYEEPLSFDDFTKGDVNRFVSAYKQKINRAEKESLLKSFQGKIGELVTGVVEKSDSSSAIVNLGRISVTLFQRDLIGKEIFKAGDSIRVYVCGISKDDVKGNSLIHCSRSCPEFLEKLFENEIREIYDGTVKIYKVARIAGVRSKVAVYSQDPNVDPSGACIGQNGSRILSIVSQLGNDRNSKEKIDVVEYSENMGMFLKECIKPGQFIGAKFEDTPDGKKAYVICGNDTGSAAIGFRGTNIVLARQLTGIKDIQVMDESVAKENNFEYTPLSVFEEEARNLEKEKFREQSIKNAELGVAKTATSVEVLPVVNDEDFLDKDFDLDEVENEPIVENEKKVEPVVETSEPIISEVKAEEKPVESIPEPVVEVKEEKKPEEEFHEVKTTTTLDQLEASLETDKKNEKPYKSHDNFKDHKFKKPVKKAVNEEPKDIVIPVIDEKNKMSIYTQEELEEMEKEEKNNDHSIDSTDEDYSEYDSDEYYDK